MSRDRITVTREGGEVVFEATVHLVHPGSKATRLDPPESAEYEIDECWRTVGDGPEVKLRPDNLPDDVYDEILTCADEGPGPVDDREHDDDPREDDRDDRDYPY